MRMRIICILFISIIWAGCSDEMNDQICSTPATVVDLTGLDGCGFVFELEDGTRLEPLRLMYCGTPPLPAEVTEDALYNFDFADGKKVLIDYDEVEYASYCQAGQMVKITCISDLSVQSDL